MSRQTEDRAAQLAVGRPQYQADLADGLDGFFEPRLVDEELWAGKIARAVWDHPGGPSPQGLEQATGAAAGHDHGGFRWLGARLAENRSQPETDG